MRKIVILGVAIAALAQISSAATCTSGTLAGYIGLGSSGCTIGSDTLSSFQLLAGTTGATEIAAANVLLSPTGASANPGLITSVNVVSMTGSVQETLFTYQLSGSSYNSAAISLSNASESGDGAVTGLLNFCAGGAFGADGVSACTGVTGGLATVDGAQNQDSAAFTPVNLLSITNDLTIDGGTAGSATGGALFEQFGATATATPEPISVWLTGIGLALVAVRRLKFSGTGVVRK